MRKAPEMNKISQREARRLRKRVAMFDRMAKRGWHNSFPEDSVGILTMCLNEAIVERDLAIVRVARQLGHPVLVVPDGSMLYFLALKRHGD